MASLVWKDIKRHDLCIPYHAADAGAVVALSSNNPGNMSAMVVDMVMWLICDKVPPMRVVFVVIVVIILSSFAFKFRFVGPNIVF